MTNIITEDHSFSSRWLIAIFPTATSNETNMTNLQTIKPVKDSLKTVKLLTLSSLNCRSVKNKALSSADFVTSRNIDILALTETWLGTSINTQVLSELLPPGYDILRVARRDKRGGTVAVLFREVLVLNIIQYTKGGIFTQFEHMELSMKAGKNQIGLCSIYHPPPSEQNRFKATMFLDEWSNYLDRLTTIPQEVIIIRDLNFYFNDPIDINVRRFMGQLDAYGLV